MRIVVVSMLVWRTTAADPIAGNAAVAADAPLYASPTAIHARAEPASERAIAMTVVSVTGDVVELSTARVQDCLPSFAAPYELHVFVAKSALLRRTSAPWTRSFADGTAISIDRGAPVRPDGTWDDPILAAFALSPERLVLAVPPAASPVELPSPVGDRMVCDPQPISLDDWKIQRRRELAAARAPATSDRPGVVDLPDAMAGRELGAPPWCHVARGSIGGKLILGPSWLTADVRRDATGLRADFETSCARARAVVDAASLSRGGAGRGVRGRSDWFPAPGPVVWPDGHPAGRYTGGARYRADEIEDRGELRCVRVPPVVERVCHHR